MAWSIFSQGGGPGAAKTWAQDLLKGIGAPVTPGNVQMVYQWEESEGGGGEYNPLNQGPVPGDPSLTSSGSQYGGGAANYVSWDAGLSGAEAYLAMPAYQQVTAALIGNDPQLAEQALFASPWAASHYGYGSAWSGAKPPAKATALPGGGGSSGGGFDWNPLSWPGQVLNAAGSAASDATGGLVSGLSGDLEEFAVLGAIVLAGAGLVLAGLIKASGQGPRIRSAAAGSAQTAATIGAVAA